MVSAKWTEQGTLAEGMSSHQCVNRLLRDRNASAVDGDCLRGALHGI